MLELNFERYVEEAAHGMHGGHARGETRADGPKMPDLPDEALFE